jgi:hypothetical protein
MNAVADGFVSGLKKCFAEVRDPRVQGRCEHLLLDILAIAILGVLCGAEDWPDLEEFGRRRADWLRGFLALPNGIPSHDTFRRVFGLLERQQFAAGLFQWTQALHEATGGKLIALDGKTARRSGRKKSGLGALHLVTAWATESGLTLGQVACADKSNEITALPELLTLLDLRGCTVTCDAMGCQKEIAAQVRDQKGHYVLALKDNQPGLAEDMRRLFGEGIETDFAGLRYTTLYSLPAAVLADHFPPPGKVFGPPLHSVARGFPAHGLPMIRASAGCCCRRRPGDCGPTSCCFPATWDKPAGMDGLVAPDRTGCLACDYNERRVAARLWGGVRWPGRGENRVAKGRNAAPSALPICPTTGRWKA